MAGEAGCYGVRLQKTRRLARVRVVTIGAVSICPWMLHFGRRNLFRFVFVARDANRLGVLCCQDNFSIFRSLVAGVT
jgi:hypothetical protein